MTETFFFSQEEEVVNSHLFLKLLSLLKANSTKGRKPPILLCLTKHMTACVVCVITEKGSFSCKRNPKV